MPKGIPTTTSRREKVAPIAERKFLHFVCKNCVAAKRYTSHIAVALSATSSVDMSLVEESPFPVITKTSSDAKFAATNATSQNRSTWLARD
jgi:predicted nucleic-acid-binding Zn-ribbon protein